MLSSDFSRMLLPNCPQPFKTEEKTELRLLAVSVSAPVETWQPLNHYLSRSTFNLLFSSLLCSRFCLTSDTSNVGRLQDNQDVPEEAKEGGKGGVRPDLHLQAPLQPNQAL